ncbi:MAG: TIGR02677 family protein [Desulfitobacterium hafniense]|nr:TIGR02677 family protein [Desulfitobacterium hafniense]
MSEQLLKPIQEATYLTVTNAWRYRSILRYFYEQHERLRHYLVLEEIYLYLREKPHFRDYSEEQLQQDLDQLVSWKNLIPRQDTGRVTSIEEFKKRKFRYQLTPYTIEIERMVLGLENLGDGFGGSLERTLFDRLLENLIKLTSCKERQGLSHYAIFDKTDEEIHLLWQDLYEDFRRLTENATDYLAHLYSEKVEEQMLTEAFLVYKEALTEYLRNFMTSLQRTSFRIEGLLQDVLEGFQVNLAERLTDYELSIPRMDMRPSREHLVERFLREWDSLRTWFIGDGSRDSDLIYLQNATNETIRRLTRFAQRLGESHHSMRNRRLDYLHLAGMFSRLDSLKEAHELSSCIFGAFNTRHLFVDRPKQTESFEVEVWDEPPAQVQIRPKVRSYKEKTRPNAVLDQSEQKKLAMEAYLEEKTLEKDLITNLIENHQIVLRNLPEVSSFIRKTLLSWIGKCMANPERKSKTETGQTVFLKKASNHSIRLQCEDGILEMPDFILTFEERAEAAR